MRPFSSIQEEEARAVDFVLMDIDDTLTKDGRLLRESFDALWKLKDLGFVVIPVTGRPAGWCDLIARQWPVDAVVGENGAFAFYMDGDRLEQLFHPRAVRPRAGSILDEVKARVLAEVPGSRVAKDQFGRIFDLAVDFAEEPPVLPRSAALRIAEIAESMGARAKISSIHVNIWLGEYDKLSMAECLLSERFHWKPNDGLGRVVFLGDSPNDEPMFARFPLACAVANFRSWADMVARQPTYITEKPYGYGFAEAADVLCRAKTAISDPFRAS